MSKSFKVLICLLLLFAGTFSGWAQQNKRLTVQVQNGTILDCIKSIESQTDYSFLFSNSIGVEKKVSVNCVNQNLDQVLTAVFSPSGIAYDIQGNQITLKKAIQSDGKRIVSGKITDSKGLPLPGVGIMLDGTTQGTISGTDGSYSITVPSRNVILEVSSIGYVTRKISINQDQTIANISLEDDILNLEETVVIGYGTQKKINLTGSIASVNSEAISKVPVSNLSNSLAGRAPGVTIVGNTGFAGASSDIRMRGSTSEPLYVINDVIKDKSAFDALDANEIETISFLKDAASASIFGSKAGNGVVVVTTKEGAHQKPIFTFTSSYSVSNTTRPLQDWTAAEELDYRNNVSISNGGSILYGPEIYQYFADKSYSVNDYVWQNPTVWQNNLSVNGGGDHITYYMMIGYHDEDGSYKNLTYNKYNFRSDITAKISDSFKVRLNISGDQRDDHRFYWPYDSVDNFTVPDFYRTTFRWSRLYPFYTDAAGNPSTERTEYPLIFSSWNPVEMVIGNRYWDTSKRRLDGQLRLDLDLGKVIPGVSTSVMAAYSLYDMNRKAFITHNIGYAFHSASETNPFIPAAPTNTTAHNLGATYPGIRQYADFSHDYQLNWYLRYNRTFGKHKVNALAIYEQEKYTDRNYNGQAWNLLTTSMDQIFVTSSDASMRNFTGSDAESARQSIIGRMNYSYADKYIAEFSFRYDGNYKFAPDYRWGFFPSISLGWRISEEGFMKDISWLNNLKIRASYGTTGDDNGISAFQWREYYTGGSSYVIGNTLKNGLKVGSTFNPYMTWATVKVYDAGIDFGMFNGRLSGEVDGFYKERSNILGSRIASIPDTYGASLAPENYARQDFHGFEAAIRWSDRISSDFDYSIYANIGYAKDKWVIYDEAEGLQEWRSRIGKPNSRLMGYKFVKMIRTQEDLAAIPEGFRQFGRTPQLGTLLFEDIRGANYSEGPDGKIDSNDQTYLSDNGAPRINYGFGFNLKWRGLGLDAHFQGVGAYDRFIASKNGNGVFQTDTPYFELWTGDVWTPENPNAKYPRVANVWQYPEYGGGGSSFWIRNGAYLRLKNLNISYDLPGSWMRAVGVDKLSVFVNATNLFSIDGMPEMDPEQATLDSYPIMRTFTGGISINF